MATATTMLEANQADTRVIKINVKTPKKKKAFSPGPPFLKTLFLTFSFLTKEFWCDPNGARKVRGKCAEHQVGVISFLLFAVFSGLRSN